MKLDDCIKLLREAAQALKPLTKSVGPGGAHWNGTAYVKVEPTEPNPYALSWYTTLGAVADVLEAQEAPLSQAQVSYLKRLLLGGSGSLNDLFFDPNIAGPTGTNVNERLDEIRRALFECFRGS
jgi:hypothetical protein